MLKQLIKKIVIWRIAIFVIALLAFLIIPFTRSFPYSRELLDPLGHPVLWSLGNFDGVHYINIAQRGYAAQFTQAFFPLYPIFIRYLDAFTNNSVLSGYIISLTSFAAFIVLLRKLIGLDFGKSVIEQTILFYFIFPTSFFFSAVYTESFFMALVVASFLAARKKKWLIAGLLAAVASATRLFGILLLPALLVEFFYQHKHQTPVTTIKNSPLKLGSIGLSATGLLLYMNYLSRNFSDALYFLHAQGVFGAQRSADKLILLYQVFWRYTKMIFTVDISSLLYYTVAQEFLLSVIFLALLIVAFKRVRLSYVVFGALSYLLPTLTGTLSSMPRYVLVLFPAFIILGKIENKTLKKAIIVFSVVLFVINVTLFTRGYWVS